MRRRVCSHVQSGLQSISASISLNASLASSCKTRPALEHEYGKRQSYDECTRDGLGGRDQLPEAAVS